MPWWGFLVLIVGSAARAEPVLFCASPEALLGTAGSCSGNGVFIEAARACLAKLNAEEESRGSVIREGARLAKQGQRVDTLAARQSYGKTVEALSRLHALAMQGHAELLAYERYLALPTLEAAPLLARDGSLSAAGALQAGCFANGMQGVRAAQGEFAAKLAMYSARRKEALAASNTLGTSLGNLKAATSVAAPVKGRGGAQPVPAGKAQKNPQSTITGKVKSEKLPE